MLLNPCLKNSQFLNFPLLILVLFLDTKCLEANYLFKRFCQGKLMKWAEYFPITDQISNWKQEIAKKNNENFNFNLFG